MKLSAPSFSAVFLLLTALPSDARIGETTEEIKVRYGVGNKSGDRLKAPNAETWKYTKGGFSVEVIFVNGKSVWEMFERKDKAISDDDIKDLLKVNGLPGASWRFDKKENRWERGGKPKLVAFREPGHADFFSIQDVETVKWAKGGDKPSTKGF